VHLQVKKVNIAAQFVQYLKIYYITNRFLCQQCELWNSLFLILRCIN